MLKKMVLITITVVTAAWAFAEPGTWGKEAPEAKDAKEMKAPAAQFNHWLKDFRAAYQQRDGEKMGQLIKDIEDKQKDMPDMPRVEKWLANVKETYEAQDVQKMDKLLDSANQIRERIRERFQENRDGRQERNNENFGQRDERFAGPRGRGADDFADNDSRPMNRMDRRDGDDRRQDDFGFRGQDNRQGEFRDHRGAPMGGEFEGPRRLRQMDSRRPMQPQFEQDGSAPRMAPRDFFVQGRITLRPYSRADRFDSQRFDDRMARPERNDRPAMRGESDQRGFAPQRSFEPWMRRQFQRQFDDQDMRDDESTQDRVVPEDFWR
jgi:hypothetical protein